jgi:hypothetical protein
MAEVITTGYDLTLCKFKYFFQTTKVLQGILLRKKGLFIDLQQEKPIITNKKNVQIHHIIL